LKQKKMLPLVIPVELQTLCCCALCKSWDGSLVWREKIVCSLYVQGCRFKLVGSFLVVRGTSLCGAGENACMLSLSDGVLRIVNQLVSFSLCKGHCSVHCLHMFSIGIADAQDQSTVFDLTGKRQRSKQTKQSTSSCQMVYYEL
jgi:hypothetical protein